ncbi:MAG: hypothetical protein VB022_11395 [Rikenellaceae bacterium]|nr:hypothetical protein [Rikenellaceae bacterium]
MHSTFIDEFSAYLLSLSLKFERRETLFIIDKAEVETSGQKLYINLELLGNDSYDILPNVDITIFEDEWITKGKLVKDRIKVNLGLQRRIYARNCHVKAISQNDAKRFLDVNHMLGYARCHYRYGLYTLKDTESLRRGSLVAVATFSSPRLIKRGEIVVNSYEWVRYAGLSDYRITGGMGKLMKCFVREQNPREIMSYADIGWGKGDAYEKLGFTLIGKTEPILFYLKKESLARIPAKALNNNDSLIKLRNKGNFKFIWSA